MDQPVSDTVQFDTVLKSNEIDPSRQQTSGPVYRSPAQVVHPYPQTQSQMQNAGMAVGGAISAVGGSNGNMAGGMIGGGDVGGIVGQRLAQAENHVFWRGQAMAYREQLATGQQPPASIGLTKQTSWWSRDGRAQRRAKRWERRAQRRDGTTVNVS